MSVPQPDKSVVPIRVPRETIEAFRRTEPLFTVFLIESGRVIVLDKMPNLSAGAQEHGIKSSAV